MAAFVKAGVIRGHDHRDGGVQGLLQGEKGGPVLLQQYVVRVQPQAVVHRRMGEGFVSGGGKVVPPEKVDDPRGKVGGDFLCAVGGAGIHDDDFIRQTSGAFQAAFQHILLVFHDHAQTDAHHIGASFDSL